MEEKEEEAKRLAEQRKLIEDQNRRRELEELARKKLNENKLLHDLRRK
jgi:hypothetical protein